MKHERNKKKTQKRHLDSNILILYPFHFFSHNRNKNKIEHFSSHLTYSPFHFTIGVRKDGNNDPGHGKVTIADSFDLVD